MQLAYELFMQPVHPEWRPLIHQALNCVSKVYLQELLDSEAWLPGKKALLAAFSLSRSATRFILLGESPYPRQPSANGYAFWDAAVGSLWSAHGFSKEVNRATSLRNLLKMFLYARGDLKQDFSQAAIAQLNQENYCQTGQDLFFSLMHHGFLLLNASLVYDHHRPVRYDAVQWRPFMGSLFEQLAREQPSLKLVLLGKIAEKIPQTKFFPALIAEHPYNISFITNPEVVNFFKPMDVLHQK